MSTCWRSADLIVTFRDVVPPGRVDSDETQARFDSRFDVAVNGDGGLERFGDHVSVSQTWARATASIRWAKASGSVTINVTRLQPWSLCLAKAANPTLVFCLGRAVYAHPVTNGAREHVQGERPRCIRDVSVHRTSARVRPCHSVGRGSRNTS